ncbi:MAG: hypothetical protein KJ831_21485, partial [Candidatus Eisenbacteria bacterium]|nr:hypothetical protein [Candidatus Eisenbacteria bacterium]
LGFLFPSVEVRDRIDGASMGEGADSLPAVLADSVKEISTHRTGTIDAKATGPVRHRKGGESNRGRQGHAQWSLTAPELILAAGVAGDDTLLLKMEGLRVNIGEREGRTRWSADWTIPGDGRPWSLLAEREGNAWEGPPRSVILKGGSLDGRWLNALTGSRFPIGEAARFTGIKGRWENELWSLEGAFQGPVVQDGISIWIGPMPADADSNQDRIHPIERFDFHIYGRTDTCPLIVEDLPTEAGLSSTADVKVLIHNHGLGTPGLETEIRLNLIKMDGVPLPGSLSPDAGSWNLAGPASGWGRLTYPLALLRGEPSPPPTWEADLHLAQGTISGFQPLEDVFQLTGSKRAIAYQQLDAHLEGWGREILIESIEAEGGSGRIDGSLAIDGARYEAYIAVVPETSDIGWLEDLQVKSPTLYARAVDNGSRRRVDLIRSRQWKAQRSSLIQKWKSRVAATEDSFLHPQED